jgi:NAD(P)-dependent dehydrogenase (short-subunit alcohol dehydrogenase family)
MIDTARVAIVTGASRGIGKATALRLARDGCDIVVSGLTAERADATAAAVRECGRKAVVCLGDVGDPETALKLVDCALTSFGRLDILVNSAGIARLVPFLELTPEIWRRFLDVHLSGTFYVGQAAARSMVSSSGGRIVNVSSIVASMGMYGVAAYSAVKGGVLSLTRVMAVELAPSGVTVNAVAPGPVATEQLRAVYDDEMYRERSRSIPLRRLAEPEEVAGAIAYLVSPDAVYVTGQVITVDGGASAIGCYSAEAYKRSAPAGAQK